MILSLLPTAFHADSDIINALFKIVIFSPDFIFTIKSLGIKISSSTVVSLLIKYKLLLSS